MRKIQLSVIVVLLSFVCVFGQKKGYWAESNASNTLDASKKYSVAVLPVVVTDAELSADATLAEQANNTIILKLADIWKFNVINKELMLGAVNTYRFGSGPVNASNYPDICKATGARLLVYCELSRNKTIIKKKEVTTVIAWIQVFDANADFSSVYSSRARSIKSMTITEEVDGAIGKALEALVLKMK
ncbi:MAG: hypothetical protein WCM76_00035 [Bacteroidota bacterium]